MKIRSDSRTRPSQLQGAMTDISFNLIIFLLVAASFAANQGIFMRLPEEESEPRELPPSQAVLVELKAEAGSYLVDGLPFPEGGLTAGIGEALDRKHPLVVVLEVAEGVAYGRVVATLEKARAAGALSFSINGPGEARAVSLPGEGP